MKLSCKSCKGKIELTNDIDQFYCAHCGTEWIVNRGGGMVNLKAVNEYTEVENSEIIFKNEIKRTKKRKQKPSFKNMAILFILLSIGSIVIIVLNSPESLNVNQNPTLKTNPPFSKTTPISKNKISNEYIKDAEEVVIEFNKLENNEEYFLHNPKKFNDYTLSISIALGQFILNHSDEYFPKFEDNLDEAVGDYLKALDVLEKGGNKSKALTHIKNGQIKVKEAIKKLEKIKQSK